MKTYKTYKTKVFKKPLRVWALDNGDKLKLYKIDRNVDGAYICINDGPIKPVLLFADQDGDFIRCNDKKYHIKKKV